MSHTATTTRYTAHFAETNIFVRQLPSIIKQRESAIYPAWLAMLPMGILYAGLVSFVDATIYTMPVYWITGLAAQFGQYVLCGRFLVEVCGGG